MPRLTRAKTERTALDWSRARARLAQFEADAEQRDPEHELRVLSERARVLARPLPSASNAAARLELLQFQLGAERYAIETRYVHQVRRPGECTRVPGAPAQLRGVTNLAGEITAVFDLRELLETGRAPASERARWLVLGEAAVELCLWVDAVDELYELDAQSLLEPASKSGGGHAWLLGLTADARCVLDARLLLADQALFVGEAAREDQPQLTKQERTS